MRDRNSDIKKTPLLSISCKKPEMFKLLKQNDLNTSQSAENKRRSFLAIPLENSMGCSGKLEGGMVFDYDQVVIWSQIHYGQSGKMRKRSKLKEIELFTSYLEKKANIPCFSHFFGIF